MAKAFYLSLNQKELVALEGAPHEEVVLYLTLKRLSDFKDGTIGNHPSSKTNCEKLAENLSRPSSQGKPAVTYDRKEISRLLNRMQLHGLVIRKESDDNDLMLRLPLSPMDYKKKDATAETSNGGDTQEKLPQVSMDQPSGSLANAEKEATKTSLSVMINNSNTINTLSNDVLNSLSRGESPTWDLEAIMNLMASRETMQHPRTQISQTIYKGWLKAGVSKEELLKAIEEVENDFLINQTPTDVNTVIKRYRTNQNRTNVGLVL